MIYDKNELPEKDKDVENRCSMCGEIRETASAFFCQSQLQFCKYCYEQLKRNYKGIIYYIKSTSPPKPTSKFQRREKTDAPVSNVNPPAVET